MAESTTTLPCIDGPWRGRDVTEPSDVVAFEVYDADAQQEARLEFKRTALVSRDLLGAIGWYERGDETCAPGWYWRPNDA